MSQFCGNVEDSREDEIQRWPEELRDIYNSAYETALGHGCTISGARNCAYKEVSYYKRALGYFERMYRVELSSLLESGLSQEEAERVARGIVEIEKRRED